MILFRTGEKIKFRIMNELFMETSPEVKTNEVKSVPENKTPYLLIVRIFYSLHYNCYCRSSRENRFNPEFADLQGSINEPGLGVLSWWDGM